MKKCPKCNEEIAWGLEVCPSCGKKVKNQKVELHLKNANAQECTISCSEKIKMSLLQLYVELGYGIPALDVKPINGKDIVITLALFFSIFVFPAIFQNGFGIFLCLAMVVVNLIYTKNFYYNAIKKKLSQGYTPADEDTSSILNNAGLGNSVASDTAGTSTSAANEGFKKFLTKRNIIIAAAVIVVCIALGNIDNDEGSGNSSTDAISIVKDGYLPGTFETMGEIVEETFSAAKIKWSSSKKGGKTYVNVKATMPDGTFEVIFLVNESNRTFAIDRTELNGKKVEYSDFF